MPLFSIGIDIGSTSVKATLFDGEKIVGSFILPGAPDESSAEKAYEELLSSTRKTRAEIGNIFATGGGAKLARFANHRITEITAVARGAILLAPEVRSVIDVGAEDARCILCNERGEPVNFLISDKCAAGTGIFLETAARALETTPPEMDRLYFQAQRSAEIRSQCVVFAESEVVSLIHQNVPREEIVRAVISALSRRTAILAQRVGVSAPVAVAGGTALSAAFCDALAKELKLRLFALPNPRLVGALGAAALAFESGYCRQ